MSMLQYAWTGIAGAALIAAAVLVILYRRSTRTLLGKLGQMLDTAINGSFQESVYDESALSALEAKLARYLSLQAVSSHKLLTEKDKIKELISDISHQTKTPIANILLYSQLLGEQDLPEESAVCVKALAAQAEKLNFLISSLVKISRLETGIITVAPQKEPVSELLAQALEQIRPKAEAKGIDITVEAPAICACFDLKWTVEAVYNLIDNAVKYTGSGGHILIKAIPYELFCRLDIIDNGIGIAEAEQGKIFTRFYRSPAVNNQEGVGIGLFLAREIVAAEGGYLKVSSSLGSGSTFSVFLPLPA